jgi:site-specific recombinase XerC
LPHRERVGADCGPDVFRHTFAVNFLRDSGQEFTLMHILGHTTLNQTRK